MKFSEEGKAASNITNVELEALKRRFDVVEAALARKDYASLSESVPEMGASIGKVEAANNAVSSTLSAALKVTDAPDVASFTVENEGVKELAYETPFKKPQVLVSLVIYYTLKRLAGGED